MFGYAGGLYEYYIRGQLRGKIHNINVPTLALNAEDDLFTPEDSLPLDEAKGSDHFAMITTKYGGHQAFMEGMVPSLYGFSDRVFEQYARAVFFKTDTFFQNAFKDVPQRNKLNKTLE